MDKAEVAAILDEIAMLLELQGENPFRANAYAKASRVIAQLKGFGEKTQKNILEGLAFLDQMGNRVRLDQALTIAESIVERLQKVPGIQRLELCGSVRRRKETIRDIDILVSADDAAPIMDVFVNMPNIHKVVGHGETKSSVTFTG